MKTNLILIAFAALLLFSGCKVKQNAISSNTSERNDSVVTVIVKDTFIKWLPQIQSIKTNQKSKLSTDFSFSEAWIDSVGLLNHSIQNFHVIPSKVTEKKVEVKKYRNSDRYKEVHITKTVAVTKTKTAWLGKIDWMLIVITLLIGIYKLYRKFKI